MSNGYRYYAETEPEDGHRLLSVDVDRVFGGSELQFPRYWDRPEAFSSLETSEFCSCCCCRFWRIIDSVANK